MGKIIDIRYNPADGSIRYLLVAFGGLWGEREVFLLNNAQNLIRWSGQ